jgi:uroporphyrin-III C-methyltransferase
MTRLPTAFFDTLPALQPGWVWLVGGGPGDPGLITALGLKALGEADVILHDALIDDRLLALARPDAEKIYAGKRAGVKSCKQDEICDELVRQAKAGRRVLRLKGGDPFVFGRGGEEAQALARAGVPFRVVPGITAGIGGLAYAGIPVTHRDTNHAVIFLTGHDETGAMPQSVDWRAIATAAPVIVMFMAVKHLAAIADRLVAAGRDPADRLAVVSHAALPQQSVVETTLGAAATLTNLPTPAIVVLGPVNRYREILEWYTPDLRGHALG